MNILITGGAGYIGSHTAVELINAGHTAIILDNFDNSSPKVLQRIQEITGVAPMFYQGDIRDRSILQKIFAEHKIHSVLHCAALKAVGESVRQPLRYYDNNISGSLILLEEMQKAGVHSIVFSSSATVYGDPEIVPITENSPTGATTNPYGTSKHMMERMMQDHPIGALSCCATSTPSARTPAAKSANSPTASPTTYCPTFAKLPQASSKNSPCLATTTPPPTAPACATTSTSSI